MDHADDEPMPAWRSAPPSVGAVLVTHNGGRWLPQVLRSFGEMDHAPTAWRVVDVSSTDDGAETVRSTFGADRVTYVPSGTGFAEAVHRGLQDLPPTDWIWLLHDDASVLPGTLSALLDEATSHDDIAVVGPKIREWPSLKRLLEVGLTVTSTGSRETELETGEPDAGQHDWPRDVLAVNTAGMLVRRDVWDELGGLDTGLPLYFDDIDLGWRVARAGYRTRIAPKAVIFHAEASRRGVRRRGAGDVEPWEQRRAALHTVLANTSGWRFWWQYVRLLVGTLLRTLGLLVVRDPESAGDELQALSSVYGHPSRLREARRRRQATARRDDGAIRDLFAPFWLPYRHGYDATRDAVVSLVRPESVESVGRRSTVGEVDTDQPLDDGPSLWRRRPWLVTVLVLTLLSLVAARDVLVGPVGSSLLGGALPPTPSTAGAWWTTWFASAHDVGLGSTTWPPTSVLLLAAAGTPLWFAPGVLVGSLVLLSVPLAGLTAHRLGRRLTDRRGPRIVWAVGYALAVVATGAVAQGRLGTLVALVVLPIVAITTLQLLEATEGLRRVALRWGIWVAVAAAFAPVVLPLAVVGIAGLVVVERRLLRPALIGVAVALVLLGPWLLTLVVHPSRVWWEAGRALGGADPGVATALDLVLGRAGAPVQAPAWLSAGLLVLAVAALVPRATRVAVATCWLLGLGCLAVAVVGVLVTPVVPGTDTELRPWVAVPAVAWLLCLGTAALVAFTSSALRWSRPTAAVVLALALLLPVGTGAWWLVRGVDGPLDRARADVVPAFLADRPGDTLVVSGTVASGIDVRVVRDDGPFLGQESLRPEADRSREVATTVERLLSASGADDVRALGDLGVDAVYAPDVDLPVARALDAAPLLEPSGSDAPTSRVWTLVESPESSDPAGDWWRPWVAGAHLLVWIVAIVLTAPVRRREVAVDDEEVHA